MSLKRGYTLREIAKKLIELGISIENICVATGLMPDQIKEI